jgi:cytochrome c oxidase subunit 2
MGLGKKIAGIGSFVAGLALSGAVFAQDALSGLESVGKPIPQGMGFQPAVTETARDLQWLDHMILYIITAICILVLALILIVIVRYNRRANPNPATFTHNSVVEVIWTLGPIVVLIFIGTFSLPALFKQLEIPEPDLTIKVTGSQWYWTYDYVDHGFGFDSYMIGQPATLDGDRAYVLNDEVKAKLAEAGYAEDEFLLATDTAVVVPVNKIVVMQITGADVIHSWTIPAFGVKLDAVPGRLAETWFKAEREGVYFGQCSELCGKDHAYMPITVKVVSEAAYAEWLKSAEEEYAGTGSTLTVASN